ncbi:hypothetical protein MUK42_33216 [Musa troglodytarum]|uniref:Pentatricopeptide repeat-containing protein n=1 Tax=Musa troglodytarum TaxID=320322 RepID=A0A9E7H6S5_9LILI|nr:hypothetical protein MUK42_33216 [Musa troglodytarum]
MLTRPVQIRPIVTIGRPRQSPLSKAPARLAPVLTLNGSSSSSSSCSAILARPLSRNSTSGTLHCPSLPFPSFFPVAPLAWLSFAQLFFPAHLLSYYDKQRFSGSVAVKDCWGFMLPGSHVAAEARNLISYNTMIAAHGNHGHATAALEILKQMRYEGFVADSVTFVGLLTACSHAGLVDEGLVLFNSMQETYGICPMIEHLSCLIDMLGRSGRLEEAECYVKTSAFQNDSVIWGNLLSSCRLHKNVVVGERAAIKVLELQPGTSSPYVLLSNLYASDGRWEDVAEARKMLKCTGVKKEPGHSFMEVKGIAEKFTVEPPLRGLVLDKSANNLKHGLLRSILIWWNQCGLAIAELQPFEDSASQLAEFASNRAPHSLVCVPVEKHGVPGLLMILPNNSCNRAKPEMFSYVVP